jgi:hypothetical protein
LKLPDGFPKTIHDFPKTFDGFRKKLHPVREVPNGVRRRFAINSASTDP